MIGNDNIVIKEYNGIEYLQFKRLLSYNIKHAYSLKNDKLNFRSSSEISEDSYKKFYEVIGLDYKTHVKPIQTHTRNVRCIDKVVESFVLKDVDGLITDSKNVTLATTNADCIIINLYDSQKKVIANVHSGWRGTFQKIIQNAVMKMVNNYKSNPEDIECFIYPSIRKCHFEVEEDVKLLCEEIFAYTKKLDEIISIGRQVDEVQKYNIDTVLINRILLNELGIKDENIFDCGICSVCNCDKINSRRADGKDFRLGTSIISLD